MKKALDPVSSGVPFLRFHCAVSDASVQNKQFDPYIISPFNFWKMCDFV